MPNPFAKETLLQMLGIWLGVFPSVLFFSYLLRPLGLPLPVDIFLSTLCTVPLISLIVAPLTARFVDRATEDGEDDAA
ncbi:MAG: hypothetical protein AAF371_04540 [Pseudomonadota bacterium]